MKVRALALVIATLFVSTGLWAQQDPLAGTWKLNLAKSSYSPGPAPQSGMNKYEAAGPNAYKLTQDGIGAQGAKTHADNTILFDGKEHAIADNELADAQVNWRIDAHSTQRIRTKGGKLVNFLQRVLSGDGKTMTVRQIGINADGKPVSNIEIYDRQ